MDALNVLLIAGIFAVVFILPAWALERETTAPGRVLSDADMQYLEQQNRAAAMLHAHNDAVRKKQLAALSNAHA